jgi:hypothetical protein
MHHYLMKLRTGALAFGLLAGATFTATQQASAATPQPSAAMAPRSNVTVAQLLTNLPVVKPLTVGYLAVKFIPLSSRLKVDARGCDLKRQLLVEGALRKPAIGPNCSLTGGLWQVDNDQELANNPGQIVLAPVVSFKDAWGQGAYAWTPKQRFSWATFVLAPNSTRTTVDPNIASTQRFYSSAARANSSLSLGSEIACPVIANRATAMLANLTTWGLSISPERRQEITEAISRCKFGNDLVTITSQTASNNITSVPSPEAVSTTIGIDSQGSDAIIQGFTGYATPAGDVVSRQLFGLHAPPDSGAAPSIPYGYLRLWDSGVSWAEMNPARNEFNFDKLAKAITVAQGKNAAVLYVLGKTPTWASGGSDSAPPKDMAYVREFIYAMCMKFGGTIASYESWNEGNLQTFWSGSPQQLADVTLAVNDAINTCKKNYATPIDPRVFAASTGTRAEGAFANNFSLYLAALKQLNWPVDGYTVHSYPSAAGGPDERIDGLAQFKTMLALNGAPTKPIYDSEVNYGLAGLGQDHVDIDESTSAAYLSRTYIDSVRYGIASTFWFLWTDAYYSKLGIQLTPASAVTQAAWTATQSWLVGGRMQRCGEFANVTMCQLTDGGGTLSTIAWTTSGTAKINTAGIGRQVCALSGSCTPLAGSTIVIGIEPVRLLL